jgi:hypothetical protein
MTFDLSVSDDVLYLTTTLDTRYASARRTGK